MCRGKQARGKDVGPLNEPVHERKAERPVGSLTSYYGASRAKVRAKKNWPKSRSGRSLRSTGFQPVTSGVERVQGTGLEISHATSVTTSRNRSDGGFLN
jgi:hypothetical protein